MKTPEETKKGLALCENVDSYIYSCDECPYEKEEDGCKSMMADALAYIKQLEAQVPKWISVEDRLPETQDKVILALRNECGEIRIVIGYRAHWTPFRYYIDGGNCAVDADRVTHWMPLPELPQEET